MSAPTHGHGRVPVIVLTSSSQQEDIIDSYRNGANSYVRKRVDFDEFASAVAQLGLYWAILNEPPPRTADPASMTAAPGRSFGGTSVPRVVDAPLMPRTPNDVAPRSTSTEPSGRSARLVLASGWQPTQRRFPSDPG